MEKEYRILVRSEMYFDIWAENEDAAQEELHDRLWEDSKDFVNAAEIDSVRELE